MSRPLLIAVLAAALSALAAVEASGQGLHKNPRGGFSLRPPSGWTEVPMAAGEEWILAQFLSDRTYTHTDRTTGFGIQHRPLMRVIAFPRNAKRVEKTDAGAGVTVTSIKDPYTGYEDFMRRNHQNEGWFVGKDEAGESGGVKTTYQEIVFEKLTVPRRHLALVHHFDDRDLVVEVDVIESKVADLKGVLVPALRSLRALAADPASAADAAAAKDVPRPGNLLIITGLDEKEAAEKIAARRKEWQLHVLKQAEENLPAGWKKIRNPDFIILNHGPAKYSDYLSQQARHVRKWLEREFKDVGDGEVLPALIRICANSDEESAYRGGSNGVWSFDSGEVVCSAGSGWELMDDFSNVAQGMTRQFFDGKNPKLWAALPDWLSSGLSAYVNGARVTKIRGFIFLPNAWQWRQAIVWAKAGKLAPLEELLGQPAEDVSKARGEDAGYAFTLYELFVRFLLDGDGQKGKTAKFIPATIKRALEALEARDASGWKTWAVQRSARKEPVTEEEEEAEFKRRRDESKEWEKAAAEERRKLVADLHAKIFEGWTAADWKKLDAAFRKFVLTGL